MTALATALLSKNLQEKIASQRKFVLGLKEGEEYRTGKLEETLVFLEKISAGHQSISYYSDEEGNKYLFWDVRPGVVRYFDRVQIKQ